MIDDESERRELLLAYINKGEFIGEMGPAARAQRQEFKKAATRMRSGSFGFTEGQRQQAGAVARQGIANQQAQQGAAVARMQAAGLLGGGAAANAMGQIAARGQQAQAATEANIQAASDAKAQQQYAQDQATIDAQADRRREMWRRQAQISQSATNSGYTAPPPQVGQMKAAGARPSAFTDEQSPQSTLSY